MLYFAYGSNLLKGQMQARCPSACYTANARLNNHRLVFSRESRPENWDGGVADVVAATGETVWGVIYRIADRDVPRLDRAEGPGYRRDSKDVIAMDSAGESTKRVEVYVAIPEPGRPFLPSRKYLDAIVSGAISWNLPEEYIRALENQPTRGSSRSQRSV